jgi:hypothetical protein
MADRPLEFPQTPLDGATGDEPTVVGFELIIKLLCTKCHNDRVSRQRSRRRVSVVSDRILSVVPVLEPGRSANAHGAGRFGAHGPDHQSTQAQQDRAGASHTADADSAHVDGPEENGTGQITVAGRSRRSRRPFRTHDRTLHRGWQTARVPRRHPAGEAARIRRGRIVETYRSQTERLTRPRASDESGRHPLT